MSVEDSQGNIRRSVTEVLDAFFEAITPHDISSNDMITTHVADKANRKVELDFNDMSAHALGLTSHNKEYTLSLATKQDANAAVKVADTALYRVSEELVKVGAMLARLEYTADNLLTYTENLTAAESTIRDADLAKEWVDYTSSNVNSQQAEAMLQFLQSNSDWFVNLIG
ncbi:MAG: hypothetical protein IJ728_13485 [Selenomonadaceae bacterium]|nr:hypothetical protein [Selenomonadaceae bacterium]